MPPTPKAAAPAKVTRVKVRATRTGYYDEERKRAGAVFIYRLTEAEEKATRDKRRAAGDDENDGLPTWLAKVDPRTPEQNSTGQQEIDRQAQDVRDQRAAAKSSTDAEVL